MNIDLFNDLSKFVDGKIDVFVIVGDMDIIGKRLEMCRQSILRNNNIRRFGNVSYIQSC